MMKRYLFFPFTYVSARQYRELMTFFSTMEFFSASDHQPDDDRLGRSARGEKIRVHHIPAESARALDAQMAQYLEWAGLHKGNEKNLKLFLRDNPYFMEDTQVTSITSQLRGADKKASGEDDPQTAFSQKLLFLKMAHLNDMQHEELDREITKLDKTRDSVFRELKGIPPSAGDPAVAQKASREAGRTMIRERIACWSGCMAQICPEDGWGENSIFVTTSTTVFAYLESICSKQINALDINSIKVHEDDCEHKNEWQRCLNAFLERAVQGDGAPEKEDLPYRQDACEGEGQLKLSLFSGNEINGLFNLSKKVTAVCLAKLK